MPEHARQRKLTGWRQHRDGERLHVRDAQFLGQVRSRERLLVSDDHLGAAWTAPPSSCPRACPGSPGRPPREAEAACVRAQAQASGSRRGSARTRPGRRERAARTRRPPRASRHARARRAAASAAKGSTSPVLPAASTITAAIPDALTTLIGKPSSKPGRYCIAGAGSSPARSAG